MWFIITKINDESTTLGFGLGDQTSFRLTPNEFENNKAKHSREEKRREEERRGKKRMAKSNL